MDALARFLATLLDRVLTISGPTLIRILAQAIVEARRNVVVDSMEDTVLEDALRGAIRDDAAHYGGVRTDDENGPRS